MKIPCLLFVSILLSGCIKSSSVQFSGTTPGIKSGVFIVKTLNDSSIYGENIKDGKFATAEKQLKYPGYYNMNITDDGNTTEHEPFEIYLEDGKYTFETEEGKLYKYPKVTSASKIQQQLSAFYTLVDKMSAESIKQAKQLDEDVKTKGTALSAAEYTKLLNKLTDAQNKVAANNVNAFREFVKQYPQSPISAHLITKLNYTDDPKSYYDIYQTLSPEAKNSDEGKEVGDKLSHLIKLIPGASAPVISGNTADGKPFAFKQGNKRYVLIDFWRAGNEVSRKNHQLLRELLDNNSEAKKNLEIVSVSLDTKADWWTTAISQDNMAWTQVSDLKGDDSPNAVNWSISTMPTYFLLDNTWTIVKSNIDILRVDKDVADYFATHH